MLVHELHKPDDTGVSQFSNIKDQLPNLFIVQKFFEGGHAHSGGAVMAILTTLWM